MNRLFLQVGLFEKAADDSTYLNMELVVTVAIVILGIIFTGAFLSLIIICQQKNVRDRTCRYVIKLSKSHVR